MALNKSLSLSFSALISPLSGTSLSYSHQSHFEFYKCFPIVVKWIPEQTDACLAITCEKVVEELYAITTKICRDNEESPANITTLRILAVITTVQDQ